MADEPNIVLEQLRAIRGENAEIIRKLDLLTVRMSAVETGLAQVRKEVSLMNETIMHQWTVLDQYEKRLTRLEKRAELIDGPDENANP